MNFNQYFVILWSRKVIAISILFFTVLITALVNLSLPKQYVATTSVMVDQRSVDPVTGQSMAAQLLPGYIASQVDIITSHNVALKVVEELSKSKDYQSNQSELNNRNIEVGNLNPVLKIVHKLSQNNLNIGEYSQMEKDFSNSGNSGEFRDWAADSLLSKLEVRPSRDSNKIQIDITTTDPKSSAEIANAFAHAYIKTSIELRSQPAKLTADWFGSQMALLRENLEHAQTVLSNYQQEHGIVENVDRINTGRIVDNEQARLGDLTKQLIEIQSHTNELQSRKELLASILKKGGSLDSLQEVLDSRLIQGLRAELSKSSGELAELSQKFNKKHIIYKQAEAKVKNLQNEIKSATKILLNNIESAFTAAKSQEAKLMHSLASQKAKVMNLKKNHDQIAVLDREVENAQRAYDEVMHRAVQTRMESEMTQTNIAILNPAITPQKPAKPSFQKNLILSFVIGCVLGIFSAFLAEVFDRRVRTSFDISDSLAIPVFTIDAANRLKVNG